MQKLVSSNYAHRDRLVINRRPMRCDEWLDGVIARVSHTMNDYQEPRKLRLHNTMDTRESIAMSCWCRDHVPDVKGIGPASANGVTSNCI